jgi:hypothetical protein
MTIPCKIGQWLDPIDKISPCHLPVVYNNGLKTGLLEHLGLSWAVCGLKFVVKTFVRQSFIHILSQDSLLPPCGPKGGWPYYCVCFVTAFILVSWMSFDSFDTYTELIYCILSGLSAAFRLCYCTLDSCLLERGSDCCQLVCTAGFVPIVYCWLAGL